MTLDSECVYMEEIKDKKLLDEVTGIFAQCGIDSDKLGKENPIEIVHDSNVVFDIRVFDPYHHACNLYTGADGWTNWLCAWEDSMGNDTGTVLDEYDGVPQDS